MSVALNVDPEVLSAFCWYGAVLLVKLLLMAPLTAAQRFKTKTFISPEDTKTIPGAKVGIAEDVERVRRAHLNDLENVVPFLLTGLLYVLSAGPSYWAALLHFRIFTAARICHTVAYLLQIPQPARGFSYFAGLFVWISMLIQILI